MSANTASFPIEETTIAALHAAYLDGRATAMSASASASELLTMIARRAGPLGS
jgi:hypothetical protein